MVCKICINIAALLIELCCSDIFVGAGAGASIFTIYCINQLSIRVCIRFIIVIPLCLRLVQRLLRRTDRIIVRLGAAKAGQLLLIAVDFRRQSLHPGFQSVVLRFSRGVLITLLLGGLQLGYGEIGGPFVGLHGGKVALGVGYLLVGDEIGVPLLDGLFQVLAGRFDLLVVRGIVLGESEHLLLIADAGLIQGFLGGCQLGALHVA